MKRLVLFFMIALSLTETHTSNVLSLPSFQEAIHTYYSDPMIFRTKLFRTTSNLDATEHDIRNKKLSPHIGSLMLCEADHLLRDQPLNQYRKKIIFTIIALLKAQRNNQYFAFHHSNHTVTLQTLIENTVRKLHNEPLVPPYIW